MKLKYKVVIIDDNDLVLRSMEKLIPWNLLSCEVIATESSGTAGEMAVSHLSPDIIITDIKMPGIDGLEMINKIRRYNTDALIIIITGYSDFSYAQQAIRMGVFDFITKPISYKMLTQIIEKACLFLEERRKEKHIIESIADKYKKLSESYRDKTGYIKKSFLYDMILGTLHDGAMIERMLKETNLYRKPYQIIFFYTVKAVKNGYEKILRWFEVQKKACSVLHDGVCLKNGDDFLLLIFYKTTITTDKAEKMQKLMIKNAVCFAEDTGKGFYVLADEIRNDTGMMKKSCDVIFSYRNNKLINDVIEKYAFVPNLTGKTSEVFYDFEKIEKVKEMLISPTGVDKKQILLSFIDELVNRHIDLYILKSLLGELFTAMLEGERELNGINAACINMQAVWEKIDAVRTRSQLEECIGFFMDEIINNKAARQPSMPLVRQVLLYIRDNCSKDITLSEISTKFGFSASYLGSIIKKETGSRYSEILAKYRIETAMKLLKNPLVKINEAGRMAGFKEYKYFYQVFRKYVGMSPKEYIRKGD